MSSSRIAGLVAAVGGMAVIGIVLAIIVAVGGITSAVGTLADHPLCFVFGCSSTTTPAQLTVANLPAPASTSGLTPAQLALDEAAAAGNLPASLFIAVLQAGYPTLTPAQFAQYIVPAPTYPGVPVVTTCTTSKTGKTTTTTCTTKPGPPSIGNAVDLAFAQARYLAALGINGSASKQTATTNVLVLLKCGSDSNACISTDQVWAIDVVREAATIGGLTPPGTSGSTSSPGTFTGTLGPPVDIGAVNAPTAIVTLDKAVAAGSSCGVSASLLLAQQYIESGYDPTAVSGAGAEGLSQFEPSTFAEYDLPVPPGGANPPSVWDPTDAAWAEARMLCGDGVASNPTLALVTYNCGNPGLSCQVIAAGYASTILSLAARIAA